MLEPQAQMIGTVNEDFAVERWPVTCSKLGNQSYRIIRVERVRCASKTAEG